MRNIKVLAVIWALLFSVVLGGALSMHFELSTMSTLGLVTGLFVLAFVPKLPAMAFGMAVQVEIWEKHIEGAIFADNSIINECFNADQYVLGGTVVHIPQSGGPGFANVVKNRSSFPATTVRRADTDVTYALDTFTSDPVVIPFIDQYQYSYDSRQSVLGEQMNNMLQLMTLELLYRWCYLLPSSVILNASGDPVAATAPSATGTRSSANLLDLQNARTVLARQNKFVNGQMVALVPSSMLPQMFPANDLTTATYMNQVTEEERRNGIIYKVHGFQIKERSTGLIYASDGSLKAVGAAGAAGDCEAILCYNKMSVERAKGEIKMFAQNDSPTEYGDVYSFLARLGGRRRRAGNEGLCVIQQSAANVL